MFGNRFVVLVLFSLAVAILVGCAVSTPAVPTATKPALDTTPAKIRFGYVTGVALPTLIIAEDQGFLAKENLSLEKNAFNGTGPVSDALAAGNLDLGNTAPGPSILATVKGAKTIMVSGFENTFVDKTGKSWEAVYVIVRSGEGIRTLTDLKGKKVAVSDLGSNYNYALRARMYEKQIDPDKDLTIVPIPYAQMPSALMQKLVDATLMSADGYLQVQKLGKVEVIATHTTLMNLDMDLSGAIAVNTDFVQRNPDAVVRFLRAFLQARRWMAEDIAKNDGKNLIDLVGKSMKYSPEQAKNLYETRGGYYGKDLEFVNVLDVPVRVVNRQFEVLKLNGLIKPEVSASYEQVVNIRLLKQAYDSLGIPWDESKH